MMILPNFGGDEGPIWLQNLTLFEYIYIYDYFHKFPRLISNTFKYGFIHVFQHSDSYKVNETLLIIILFTYSHI